VNGSVAIPGARATGMPPSVRVPADASIDANVRIGERVVLGSGVRIVGPSVVGDDAVIEDGVLLERSIVWNRARIGAPATLRDAIVGEAYTVPADTTLIEAIVANEPIASP
jgi:NDP-sugar pyrophosphorylase family protein